MKKTRLLIATLVCAVMLMGVGYAWWTDTITLGGTVATGNMDVVFSQADLSGFDSIAGASALLSADKKTITCNFTNLYPGAQGILNTGITNNSSIPVKLSNVNVAFTGDAAQLKSHLLVSLNPNSDFVTIDQFVNNIRGEISNLDIGENVSGQLYFKMNEEAPNDTTEGKSIGLNITFDWQQFNR
jgi:hypothetical protein